MSRYYFHTEDGQCFPDEDGVELPDIHAAQNMAIRHAADMAQAIDDIWDQGSLSVTVEDERGMTLYTVSLVLTRSAATGAG